jgi:hypothetical protein
VVVVVGDAVAVVVRDQIALLQKLLLVSASGRSASLDYLLLIRLSVECARNVDGHAFLIVLRDMEFTAFTLLPLSVCVLWNPFATSNFVWSLSQ